MKIRLQREKLYKGKQIRQKGKENKKNPLYKRNIDFIEGEGKGEGVEGYN